LEETPDSWQTQRIVVDGIVVRFVDDSNYLTVIVERPLEAGKSDLFVEELANKLSIVENCRCDIRRIG
jgi:hypothetical protein